MFWLRGQTAPAAGTNYEFRLVFLTREMRRGLTESLHPYGAVRVAGGFHATGQSFVITACNEPEPGIPDSGWYTTEMTCQGQVTGQHKLIGAESFNCRTVSPKIKLIKHLQCLLKDVYCTTRARRRQNAAT